MSGWIQATMQQNTISSENKLGMHTSFWYLKNPILIERGTIEISVANLGGINAESTILSF